MRGLWTMVGNDLRQRIRDKSVLIFSSLSRWHSWAS